MEPVLNSQFLFNGSSFTEPPLKILLVEDNPGDVIIVRELIKSSGISFILSYASNLKDTYFQCSTGEYDVILLDLGLPGSSGIETLKRVLEFRIKSPIVVLTGLDDEDLALEALREGAQDYLVKNKLSSDNIIRSIKYGIERKKIEDLHKKHTHQFSILSAATGAITRCENITSIYSVTCQEIIFLLDNSKVFTIELIDRQTIKISCNEWIEPWIEIIRNLTGVDMNNTIYHLNGQEKGLLGHLNDGRLHEIMGGFYSIFAGNVSSDDCTELGKIMNVSSIYAIGFKKGNYFYGGTIIFSQRKIDDDEIKIIETICSQASLSIHKMSIEKELRLSEDRFKKQSQELEEKVKERTKDLESLNFQLQNELTERNLAQDLLRNSESRLKELNATKDKFFNIVAHDLKNPFTSLLGSSELLFNNIHQMDTEQIKDLAVILNDSAKSGYSILLNLLDWSRSQTGLLKFKPERINLRELIDENILYLQLSAVNKEIYLYHKEKEDIFIFADKNMINTVLRNLMSNAVKFTYRGGKIIVSARITSDEAIISVKDTGIGISAEMMEKLFRIDTDYSLPGTEKEQGTGLGLKLCKEFVEKQFGRLWVESSENKGSDFKFTIPLKKS